LRQHGQQQQPQRDWRQQTHFWKPKRLKHGFFRD
jgi:hypothetical protein